MRLASNAFLRQIRMASPMHRGADTSWCKKGGM